MIDKVQADLKAAMKGGDSAAVGALRMLLSSLRYALKESKGELSEEEAAAIIQKAVRSRRESVEAFRKGRREDLAQKEEAELAILNRYLPKQLEGAELEQAIDDFLKESGITEKREIGKAMKEFMSRHQGRVDGKVVSALMTSRLSTTPSKGSA